MKIGINNALVQPKLQKLQNQQKDENFQQNQLKSSFNEVSVSIKPEHYRANCVSFGGILNLVERKSLLAKITAKAQKAQEFKISQSKLRQDLETLQQNLKEKGKDIPQEAIEEKLYNELQKALKKTSLEPLENERRFESLRQSYEALCQAVEMVHSLPYNTETTNYALDYMQKKMRDLQHVMQNIPEEQRINSEERTRDISNAQTIMQMAQSTIRGEQFSGQSVVQI